MLFFPVVVVYRLRVLFGFANRHHSFFLFFLTLFPRFLGFNQIICDSFCCFPERNRNRMVPFIYAYT